MPNGGRSTSTIARARTRAAGATDLLVAARRDMRAIRSVPVILLSACAGLQNPDPTNLATYCTGESGYHVGYLSRAYYGVCPRESEPAFLAGLQRGRGYRAHPPPALPHPAPAG